MTVCLNVFYTFTLYVSGIHAIFVASAINRHNGVALTAQKAFPCNKHGNFRNYDSVNASETVDEMF